MSMKTLSRRSAIALVGAAAMPATVGAAIPDPVFGTIETYRCACKRLSDAIHASDDLDFPNDETEAHIDALHGLLTTMPTTTAGLAAVLAMLGRNEWKHDQVAGGTLEESVYMGALQDVPDAAFTFFERLADHIRTTPLIA